MRDLAVIIVAVLEGLTGPKQNKPISVKHRQRWLGTWDVGLSMVAGWICDRDGCPQIEVGDGFQVGRHMVRLTVIPDYDPEIVSNMSPVITVLSIIRKAADNPSAVDFRRKAK